MQLITKFQPAVLKVLLGSYVIEGCIGASSLPNAEPKGQATWAPESLWTFTVQLSSAKSAWLRGKRPTFRRTRRLVITLSSTAAQP